MYQKNFFIFYIVLHSVLHQVGSSGVVSSIEDSSRDPLTARSGDRPVPLSPRFSKFLGPGPVPDLNPEAPSSDPERS